MNAKFFTIVSNDKSITKILLFLKFIKFSTIKNDNFPFVKNFCFKFYSKSFKKKWIQKTIF